MHYLVILFTLMTAGCAALQQHDNLELLQSHAQRFNAMMRGLAAEQLLPAFESFPKVPRIWDGDVIVDDGVCPPTVIALFSDGDAEGEQRDVLKPTLVTGGWRYAVPDVTPYYFVSVRVSFNGYVAVELSDTDQDVTWLFGVCADLPSSEASCTQIPHRVMRPSAKLLLGCMGDGCPNDSPMLPQTQLQYL